ncbi:lipoprotein [Glaciecola sp. MH2013]|uniref:LPS translocon maturation chaperone LptM n=1 Tax=Glaciecola sp. MH2013 TaxID=2785524 RepID=UPI00189D67E7|nr:lipoprotein [Glaciecola sp. MH2013]MBF7073649.1 lipoprotein [Glaciecola sp. MH2013]
MNRYLKLAVVLITSAFFSACGQRGPLYLPEETPTNEEQSNAILSNSENAELLTAQAKHQQTTESL